MNSVNEKKHSKKDQNVTLNVVRNICCQKKSSPILERNLQLNKLIKFLTNFAKFNLKSPSSSHLTKEYCQRL